MEVHVDINFSEEPTASIFNTEELCFCETSASVYKPTRRGNPEDVQYYRRENLRSQIKFFVKQFSYETKYFPLDFVSDVISSVIVRSVL